MHWEFHLMTLVELTMGGRKKVILESWSFMIEFPVVPVIFREY